MEDKIIHKFITKVKDKLSKNKTTYPSVNEYAFSTEEIKHISEQNKQKIQELKQDVFSNKKKEEEIISIDGKTIDDSEIIYDDITSEESFLDEQEEVKGNAQLDQENDLETSQVEESQSIDVIEPKNSFVNLSEEYQKIVMNKWNAIEGKQIDKDIIDGKDLLNHNYTVTYADEAAKFIHDIRKRYEVVICYLIGFNNEKKGIYEKTIFSSTVDDEWKYLNQYIKILEKIRNFRK